MMKRKPCYKLAIRSVISILFLVTLAGCSKELNRKKAQRLLTDYYSSADWNYERTDAHFNSDGLEKAIQQGYIETGKLAMDINGEIMHHDSSLLRLTPKSGDFNHIRSSGERDESTVIEDKNWLLIEKGKFGETVKSVTGISPAAGEGEDSRFVDYIIQISLPNELKPKFINFLKTEYDRRALLKRYDDGWRVENPMVDK